VKQQDLAEIAMSFQGAATGLMTGTFFSGLPRESVAGFAAQGPLLCWKGFWALSGAFSALLGRRSDRPAGRGAGNWMLDAAPSRADAALLPRAVTPPVAPLAGAAVPVRRGALPRSRRLWSREDGFTMSGSRA